MLTDADMASADAKLAGGRGEGMLACTFRPGSRCGRTCANQVLPQGTSKVSSAPARFPALLLQTLAWPASRPRPSDRSATDCEAASQPLAHIAAWGVVCWTGASH